MLSTATTFDSTEVDTVYSATITVTADGLKYYYYPKQYYYYDYEGYSNVAAIVDGLSDNYNYTESYSVANVNSLATDNTKTGANPETKFISIYQTVTALSLTVIISA